MSNAPFETSGHDDFQNRQKQAQLVVNSGLFANALLAAAKVLAGIVGNSQALLADGINSVSDVVYFVVVKLFVKLSGKPADREHPYGHYQYETIAALVVGAFVITTGIAIFWDSVNRSYDLISHRVEPNAIRGFALIVAIATIFTKIALMIHAQKIGCATQNLAVIALCKDHRNDIFASTGASIGITFGMFGWNWADPVAGAIVAVAVVKTGFDILYEASRDLMDSVPSKSLTEQIKEILSDTHEVDTIEEVHAHRFGPYLTVNIQIGIKGSLSVTEGDQIATTAENKLIENIPMLRKVYVHYHPSKRTTSGRENIA